MTSAPVAQKDLLCSNCGGQCEYDPTSKTLTCQSCGTKHAIETDPEADPAAEQHYHPGLPHTEQPEFTQDRPYQCETCGGEVIFQGHSISTACPYCNGALVETRVTESYPTLGLIPFSVTKIAAIKSMTGWIAKRWAAPKDLATVASNGKIAGIYVPFWTFDSHEAVDYMVYYQVRQNKRTVTRTQSGSMETFFDDLLMPASPHVTPLIRDGILHDFDPDDLRPFEPAFLAGFAAERHHQSVREGLEHNAPDKDILLRNRIKQHSGRSNIYRVSYKTDTTGIRYRRILLPVWILNYTYNDKKLRIVTCGLRGRTFGERPFSTPKLFMMSMTIALIAAGFGFFWGASLLP